MHVFLTGATGFIGSRVTSELLAAGHSVLGLTRSDEGARSLAAAGARAHRGTLEDLDSLRAGAASAEAVIHTACDHDMTNFAANCEKDRRAIAAMGQALAGTRRPMVITSGVALGMPAPGEPAREDVFDAHHPIPRIASEQAGAALAASGVAVSVVRLPQVHDTAKQGLITFLVALAREKRVSGYLGDGANRWAAAPVDDVARLYRLALEAGEPGARYHAVAEEGVALRAIAETVAAGLGVPAASVAPSRAVEHFGFLGPFAGMDLTAKSDWTRERLGWRPTGPGLLADLAAMAY